MLLIHIKYMCWFLWNIYAFILRYCLIKFNQRPHFFLQIQQNKHFPFILFYSPNYRDFATNHMASNMFKKCNIFQKGVALHSMSISKSKRHKNNCSKICDKQTKIWQLAAYMQYILRYSLISSPEYFGALY